LSRGGADGSIGSWQGVDQPTESSDLRASYPTASDLGTAQRPTLTISTTGPTGPSSISQGASVVKLTGFEALSFDAYCTTEAGGDLVARNRLVGAAWLTELQPSMATQNTGRARQLT
jgi:hypothetical protein